MDITIGVQNIARDISLEVEDSPEDVLAAVEAALADGGILKLSDSKGRQVVVPGRALGWVQIGEPTKSRVGFGQT